MRTKVLNNLVPFVVIAAAVAVPRPCLGGDVSDNVRAAFEQAKTDLREADYFQYHLQLKRHRLRHQYLQQHLT